MTPSTCPTVTATVRCHPSQPQASPNHPDNREDPTVTIIIRRLLTIFALAATLLVVPATAVAQVPPHVTLQTGVHPCELQAVLENWPAGTVDLVFFDTAGHQFTFKVTFTGAEGGSDRLITAGPFGPGVWTAKAGGDASQHIPLGAECDQNPATVAPPTVSATTTGQLPFTGTPDPWPWLTSALALLGLGTALIWRGRSKGLRG